VLDAGLGSGAAGLCLLARAPGCAVAGLEIQPDLASLAARNADLNGRALEVIAGDLLSPPPDLRRRQFDHVMTNPPFDEAGRGTPSPLAQRDRAHAHGAEGIRIAAEAGVASIEHGSFLDEAGAREMARRGTVLVPTLSAGEVVESAARRGRLTGLRAEKALAAGVAMRRGTRIAARLGVPIALGTDAGVGDHGTNAREFRLMVEWGGLAPAQALAAGTGTAARLLGWQDRVGDLRPADADRVPGSHDPLPPRAAQEPDDVAGKQHLGAEARGL